MTEDDVQRQSGWWHLQDDHVHVDDIASPSAIPLGEWSPLFSQVSFTRHEYGVGLVRIRASYRLAFSAPPAANCAYLSTLCVAERGPRGGGSMDIGVASPLPHGHHQQSASIAG